MISKYTGIVDIPIVSQEEDRLNMRAFEQALATFIRFTRSPMTIAIQGEWGSGKTSLMNRLNEQLCSRNDSIFYGIWLNTWHYALIDEPGKTLADIINSLIDELVSISREEHPDKMKRLIHDVTSISKTVFRGLSQVALKSAVPGVSDDAVKAFDQVVFGEEQEKRYNLNDLRNKLSDLVEEIIEKNREKGIGKEAFLFFIDDLDRIEPRVAVSILELLKNIFDIPQCIFILAIDYDVVISGLKPKFGELNESNEREFRSFFAKISQLPFRTPVQSFYIDDFLREALLAIGFLTPGESQQEELIRTLSEFARSSLGTNPRSLKRLANSLSFINLLMQSEHGSQGQPPAMTPVKKQVCFALICLQIAFPAIYQLLADHPDFQNWDDAFAQRHHADRASLKDEVARQHYDLLASDWQRVCFAVCSRSPYLSKHTYNILRILAQIAHVAEEENLMAGDVIADIFEFSSVTNVRASAKPFLEINPVRVFFTLNQQLLPILTANLRPPLRSVERKGRIIARLPYLFEGDGGQTRVIIQLPVRQNNLGVRVGFETALPVTGALHPEGWKNLESRGKEEQFRQLWSGLIDLGDQFKGFHLCLKKEQGVRVEKGNLIATCCFQTYIDSVDHLYTHRFLEELARFITELAVRSFSFTSASWNPS